MPAITLPSVLWAARPSTTAVSAPPTAIARVFDVHQPQRDDHDDEQRHELDEEAHGRGGAGVEAVQEPWAERPPDVTGDAPTDAAIAIAAAIRTGVSVPKMSSR